MAGEVRDLPVDAVLERVLGTNDLMGVAFLRKGFALRRPLPASG